MNKKFKNQIHCIRISHKLNSTLLNSTDKSSKCDLKPKLECFYKDGVASNLDSVWDSKPNLSQIKKKKKMKKKPNLRFALSHLCAWEKARWREEDQWNWLGIWLWKFKHEHNLCTPVVFLHLSLLINWVGSFVWFFNWRGNI